MELELPPHVSFPDGQAERPCPACEGGKARQFYEVLGIPVHSCILLDDPEAARAFALGDLCLAHCPDCGFIYNDLFELGSLDYSDDYQESQGASATFRAFLRETAETLAERTQLAGGVAVEVGCGRGDFLALLSELGAARAVGIDPSSTAGTIEAPHPIEIRHKLYDGSDFELPAKVIACRHTLEHLPAVNLFAAYARAHLATSGGDALFLEVPDVLRVLREGAFWDVYHEHCSYFTLGSLERLIVSTGFAPESLELAYADQYIQLLARAVPGATEPKPQTDDLDEITTALAMFRESCSASIRRLRGRLIEIRTAGAGSTCLWGAGSKATGFLTTLGAGDDVAAVVDIDVAKQGKFVAGTGHPIVAPADLPQYQPALVLAMNPIYVDEIRRDIAALGLDIPVEPV